MAQIRNTGSVLLILLVFLPIFSLLAVDALQRKESAISIGRIYGAKVASFYRAETLLNRAEQLLSTHEFDEISWPANISVQCTFQDPTDNISLYELTAIDRYRGGRTVLKSVVACKGQKIQPEVHLPKQSQRIAFWWSSA